MDNSSNLAHPMPYWGGGVHTIWNSTHARDPVLKMASKCSFTLYAVLSRPFSPSRTRLSEFQQSVNGGPMGFADPHDRLNRSTPTIAACSSRKHCESVSRSAFAGAGLPRILDCAPSHPGGFEAFQQAGIHAARKEIFTFLFVSRRMCK